MSITMPETTTPQVDILDMPPLVTTGEALLREVMIFIRDNQDRWSQREWVSECGTTHCLAGWTYVLATGEPFTVETGKRDPKFPQRMIDTATKLLDLTDLQADALFYFVGVPDKWRELTLLERIQQTGTTHLRPPTFEEFAARVAEVTGVDVRGEH